MSFWSYLDAPRSTYSYRSPYTKQCEYTAILEAISAVGAEGTRGCAETSFFNPLSVSDVGAPTVLRAPLVAPRPPRPGVCSCVFFDLIGEASDAVLFL